MSENETENSTEFSTSEIEAIRFAFQKMKTEFPERYGGDRGKQELARVVLEALGRRVTGEKEEIVLSLPR